MNRPSVDQGGSVPCSIWLAESALLSPPASGCHNRDRGGGETCELNVTQWMTARRGSVVIQGHTPVHPWAICLKWRRCEWSSVPYCHGAGWTQQPRSYSRWLPDGSLQSRTLVTVLADIL